jgi:phosphoglycolate phosphatase
MNKIVIWDWNGTLLNDVTINHMILNSMLQKRDLKQIDLSTYKKLFRMPIIEFYYDLGFIFKTETFAEVADEYFEMYKSAFFQMSLSLGVIDVLTGIQRKNVKQYIVSAMKEPDLLDQVKEKGIFTYFEEIVGLDNVHAISKKQRAIEFVDSFSDKPQILFIGDMDHDYEVAQALGAQCILYSKGHQLIKENQNYRIIDDLHSVLNYI